VLSRRRVRLEREAPVVAVAQSLSPGRRAFTALHELGHHLQQTSDHLVEALLEQSDDGRALEEAACNSFAAAIAIPGDVVHRHIDEAGPTAHSVASLWQDPAISASRAAVCARAAERLRSPGHVLLLDSDGKVTFGDSYGLPPVRRGSDQSRIALVRDVLADPARVKQGRTAITYRDGISGQELYGQAKDMGGHVVLVAVTEHAPWNKGAFELPTRNVGPRAQWWTCTNCDHGFYAFGARCASCGAPKCEKCGQCDCRAVTERLCMGCFLKLPLPAFDGDAIRCRDCA
jgi:IrrE N-terminal-like domain